MFKFLKRLFLAYKIAKELDNLDLIVTEKSADVLLKRVNIIRHWILKSNIEEEDKIYLISSLSLAENLITNYILQEKKIREGLDKAIEKTLKSLHKKE